MTLKYSVENTLVVTVWDDRGRDLSEFGRGRGVRDVTIVATVLSWCLNTQWCFHLKPRLQLELRHRCSQCVIVLPHPAGPESALGPARSSWSSWYLSSAAALSGHCCPVWGKLWSLTGPGQVWREPPLGRRRCWSPREDPHWGECTLGHWRSCVPPPGPGSSYCPYQGLPSWSYCCSAVASVSYLLGPAASQQS